MREIKFRAWDKVTKEMCQVTRLMWNEGRGRYTEPMRKLTHISCNGVQMYHLADGYELMQNTGLVDKNGKEIYEGDIVKHLKYGGAWEVVYSLENTGYDLKNGEHSMHLSSLCCPYLEAIGNQYENSELLKGEG